ncbi:hypothetical protein DKX38_014601 [Salix brachista]|uniref:O-methyltransferase domain-containing protein n=1 Tax=Salix brachista TaxID=2182728 RepID=A0A5N5LFU4_9ROSI|nr:hypothetical protein DKX38_014601 [Salix brachista]
MGSVTKKEEEIREDEEEAQAEVEIWKYLFGFTNMAVVKCAIELGIADAIENNECPMTLSELSSSLGCAPSSLYRIMRFLVHHNIFKEKPWSHGATAYVQTALSRRLLKKGEKSMADLLLFESSHVMLAPWHNLSSRVLKDKSSPFEGAHGDDIWEYASKNPVHSKLIDDAMACDARLVVPEIVKGCPEVFDGVRTLVDVGGGNGTTLQMLVKAFPWIQGINFDLPYVVSVAPESEGVKHVGGDFFENVPKADAAFLMWVLHDWNDEECIKILENCKEAIQSDNGKLIIVEAVVGEEKGDKLEFVRLTLDMVMMSHTNAGKERTSKEWEYVLKEAGFSSYTIKPIRAVQSVIIASP